MTKIRHIVTGVTKEATKEEEKAVLEGGLLGYVLVRDYIEVPPLMNKTKITTFEEAELALSNLTGDDPVPPELEALLNKGNKTKGRTR